MSRQQVSSLIVLALIYILCQCKIVNSVTFVRKNPYYWVSNSSDAGIQNTAVEGQFPWMVIIHRIATLQKAQACGGTLISSSWVLTAAHCVIDKPHKYLIVLGDVDKKNIAIRFYNKKANGTAIRTSHVKIHPDYNIRANDIALLWLRRNVMFSATIQPIKLAGRSQMYNSFDGSMGLVLGWGRDGITDEDQRFLRYGHIPIIPNYQCATVWSISRRIICTEPGTGVDVCQGDSGGPLVIYRNNEFMQIGIISYGDEYCPSSNPGVLTRISSYNKWISSVTGLQYL